MYEIKKFKECIKTIDKVLDMDEVNEDALNIKSMAMFKLEN